MTSTDSEPLCVAICTYNNAQLLDRTLATVEKQVVPAEVTWSVLIVDNNSTDATGSVVDRYIDRGGIPGLRRIVESRQGLAFARKRAACESTEEILAFIDDDCLLSPNWIAQAVAGCRRHPAAGALGGRVRLLWESAPDDVLLRFARAYAAQDCGDVPRRVPFKGLPHLVGAGLVLRRTALRAAGWPDRMFLVGRCGAALTSGEDLEIVFRIQRAGFELWYDPAMELEHFIPAHRISHEYLCRLVRGQGKSKPAIRALRHGLTQNLPGRLATCVRALAELAVVCVKCVMVDLLKSGRVGARARMHLCHALSFVEGSWQFLREGSALKPEKRPEQTDDVA